MDEHKMDLLVECIARLRDMLSAGDELKEAADEFLNEYLKPEIEADPNKLKWNSAEGPSGKYEQCIQDENQTDDFKLLVESLKEHNGRMTLRTPNGSVFYWLFSDGDKIGRKLKGGK